MAASSRPTMNDVARQAGVGVATVDRVLNKRAPVKAETARRVLEAAQTLGFHATGLLRQRVDDVGPERTLGFLLQKGSQDFYRLMGEALAQATRGAAGLRGRPIIQFLEDLTPTHVASRLRDLSQRVDALAVVAADHPRVSAAIEDARERGVPTFTLLSDLNTPARAGFIGIDHRKAGRTAAWTISRVARHRGPIGIVVGSHRYLGHELCEISFRSYIREHAPDFPILEAIASFEDVQFAQEATLDLLRKHPDLAGIYVAGGGIEGVIEALRESDLARDIVVVCNEVTAETRAALIDGIVDLVIATPLDRLAQRVVAAMAEALTQKRSEATVADFLPFDLFLRENL